MPKHPNRQPKAHKAQRPTQPAPAMTDWIFGRHAVLAAIHANRREIKELWLADAKDETDLPPLPVQLHPMSTFNQKFPDQVHQGWAAKVGSLSQPSLEEVLATAQTLMVLDQVSDPHNLGAIARSVAAFGADGIILPERHSAPLSNVAFKAAVGALEHVPVVYVGNLNRTLETLAEHGFWRIGLAGDTTTTLAAATKQDKVAYVLGSEGKGLRRLVAEHCDALAAIPMAGEMESLNVSVAAGIVLYHHQQSRR